MASPSFFNLHLVNVLKTKGDTKNNVKNKIKSIEHTFNTLLEKHKYINDESKVFFIGNDIFNTQYKKSIDNISSFFVVMKKSHFFNSYNLHLIEVSQMSKLTTPQEYLWKYEGQKRRILLNSLTMDELKKLDNELSTIIYKLKEYNPEYIHYPQY